MIFTCQCCSISKEFDAARKAFDEGWDVPPYFSDVVTCPNCPSSYLILGIIPDEHLATHEANRSVSDTNPMKP